MDKSAIVPTGILLTAALVSILANTLKVWEFVSSRIGSYKKI
jgi:hypothetical protein